jgi:protein TonB
MVVTGMEGDAFVADGFPDRDSSADAAPAPLVGDELMLEEGEVEDEDMLLGMINETQPVFPGGEDALYKFLEDNVVYPSNNGHADTSGIVVVLFKIEKDGSVTDARILRDIGEGYGEAVLKVVNAMPKWKPGEVDG